MVCNPVGEPTLRILPYSKRSCTDILILLLLIAAWVATIYLFVYANDHGGDPNRIVRGVDMYGRICGVDEGVKDKPLAAWPYPPEYRFKICVENCDETQTNQNISFKHNSMDFVWYCVPALNGSVSISFSGDFASAQQMFTRGLGDIYTGRKILYFTPLIAVAMAFLYAMFTRKFAGCLVWTMILAIMCGGAFLSWTLLEWADEADIEDLDTRSKLLRIGGWTACAATVIFALIVCGLSDRIEIAIEVVKSASTSIMQMPCLILFPVWPFLFGVLYLVFWGVLALYVYSVGDWEYEATPSTVTSGTLNPTQSLKWHRDTTYNNAIVGHFFGLLWNVQLVIYFTFFVIAGAIADWYFTPKDDNGRAITDSTLIETIDNKAMEAASPKSKKNVKPTHVLSKYPICYSCCRTCRFHIGTIAFGALIIAIINFIRFCVKYLEEKTKEKSNKLQQAIFCCVQCCLKCLHCLADKLSRNGFIWTAIYGDHFLAASVGSFQLIWANLARVAAVSVVGDYLILLGKIVVSLMTCGVCGLIFQFVDPYPDELSSPIFPLVIAFIAAFFVASLFMIVYETAIDTIFLCFLVDCEYNKSGVMLAPEALRKIVQIHKAESRLEASASYNNVGDVEMARKVPPNSPSPQPVQYAVKAVYADNPKRQEAW